MNILLIDNGSKHLDSLCTLLTSYTTLIDVSSDTSLAFSGWYDLVVISGGGHRRPIINNPTYYKREIELVQNYPRPLLGICLGFELIVHAYGGYLTKIKKVAGIQEIEILQDNSVFNGRKNFQVYEAHQWAVKKLPSSLVGIAQSKDGYEIIRHATKPLFGFQFHPE